MRFLARVAPLNALLIAALLAFVADLSLRPMAESDLFFRIKVGQEILARHGLPDRNLFSFTYPDHPDVDAAWLFEVGAAALYARGGFPAIVIAKTAVLLAAFAAAFWLCRRRGAGPAATATALAVGAFVGRERFVERPHIFSLLGAVGVLIAIDLLASTTGRRAVRIGVVLCAGVALWANFHAGAFVAPVMLALAAGGAQIDRDRSGAGRRLALAALGTAVSVLATPIGVGLFRYLGLHMTLPELHSVDEFRHPTWLSDPALFICAAALLGALAFAWRRRTSWMVVLPPLVAVLLAARSVRFAADAALVTAPLIAVMLTAAGERLRPLLPGPITDRIPPVGVAGLLVGMALGPRVARQIPARIDLDESELPLSAIAFVNANGLRERMYNDFEIGSYLMFDPVGGYPRHRVFIDPRLPAYPADFHRFLGRADVTRPEWSAAMDAYGVESALLSYAGVNRRVGWWDPERYALVFRQENARVFVSRAPRFAALIASREIPATFTFSEAEGNATVPLERRPASSPVPDCEWQRRLGELTFELDGWASPRTLAAYDRALAAPAGCLRADDEARLTAWLGAVALGAGRPAEALPLLDRAISRGDRELSTLTNRAIALESVGRSNEAVAAWEAVIAHGGDSPLVARARDRRARLLK